MHAHSLLELDLTWPADIQQICIQSFARIHGRKDSPLCTELERMSGFLVLTLGHAGGLVSLINSLHPKMLPSGEVRRRRRDVLGDLLKHVSAKAAPGEAQPCGHVGLGGWVPDSARADSAGSSEWTLTTALDAECLTELRSDDLRGSASINVALARFCLRQAQEGCTEEALVQTRSLLKSVRERSKIESSLPDMFWAMLFQLTPYVDHDKSLQQDLVLACFRCAPNAATASALVQHPPGESVLDMRSHVSAGIGPSAQAFPLAFGCYAILGFRQSAMQALALQCRRLSKTTILSEAEAIIRALGPLAFEALPGYTPDQGSSSSDSQPTTWFANIIEIISTGMTDCRGFMEMDTAVLGLLQAGALVEPAGILPMLQKHVEQVVSKILHECSKRLSTERMQEIRSQFVKWLTVLKEIYHTRPAIVSGQMRHLWSGVAVVHSRRTWPSLASEAATSGDSQGVVSLPAQTYRVRGPSLSSEWESVLADLKHRVGRKATIWRDVKTAGIAQ